jgi:hypothetical protein
MKAIEETMAIIAITISNSSVLKPPATPNFGFLFGGFIAFFPMLPGTQY